MKMRDILRIIAHQVAKPKLYYKTTDNQTGTENEKAKKL